MERSYKYRIYPNASQRRLIEQTFGCCRWVWNNALDERKSLWENAGAYTSTAAQQKRFDALKRQEGHEWLAEIDSRAIQQTLRDLDRAYLNFFRRCKQGAKPGYPKFKSKREGRQSYRTQNNGRNVRISDRKHVRLPKLGDVRCSVSRMPEGRIVSATVSRTPTGKYFVSICCVDCPDPQMPPAQSPSVGIDLGLRHEFTCSNGEAIDSPKAYRKAMRRLRRQQRSLSRRRKGSANREKQRRRVARTHERVANNQARLHP